MKSVFTHPLTITPRDIDQLNHVNNEVYLRWLLEAAQAHSSSIGYTLERYLMDGLCFVVRRHELEYLAPAFMGDALVVETWITDFKTSRSTRCYRIKRQSDGKTLLEGKTLWVYINLKTGKPAEIPQEMSDRFAPFVH